jgi:predicted dehydrogenase
MHRIGIIGGGEIGQSHIERIQRIPDFTFAGVFDFDSDETKRLHKKYQLPFFNSIEELIDQSDIVDITSQDIPHFEMASQALRKSRHVFIDRALKGSLSEARKLVDLAFEADVKVQIGHVERFNPAFSIAHEYIHQPRYIEARRMIPFSSSSSEQHVVLDMMIHDIDIILSLVNSGIKRIQARGHLITNKNLDMVNAYIEFDNGCIANLSSSKMAQSASSTMHVYQDDRSFFIDLTNNTVQQIVSDADGKRNRSTLNLKSSNFDPLHSELESFQKSITENTTPYVSLMDGSNALEVALNILDKLEHWQGPSLRKHKYGNRY